MIRILLADDHALLRAGMRALLSLEPDFAIVGEAADGLEAVAQVRALKPDLVLLDVQMPRLDGLGALAAIHAESPETRVIVVTSLEDEATLFRVLAAGGSGYLLKRAAEDELIGAIRDVMAGGAFVRPALAPALTADFMARREAGEAAAEATFERLTPREREIAGLIAHGMTSQAIADRLILSVRTVETHRANLMGKLGFKSRAELVGYAMRKGLLA